MSDVRAEQGDRQHPLQESSLILEVHEEGEDESGLDRRDYEGPQHAELGEQPELGHGDRGGQENEKGQPDGRIGSGGDDDDPPHISLSWLLLT